MTTITTLVTTAGVVELHEEEGGYRWLTQEGEDTETSGRTYEEAIQAGLSAWPEGIVLVANERMSIEQAENLRAPVDAWLGT